MRVLVVASLYPKTYDPVLGNFVRAQLRELQAMGVEVVGVISPVPWSPRLLWGNDRWRAFGQEPRQVTDLGNVAVLQPRVPVFPSALGLPFGRFQGPAVRKAARTLMVSAQADLIHAHSAHPDGSVAVDLGRQYGLPVVVTIHGQDLLRSIPRGRMTRRSTARTIRQADRVVLVSRRLKKIAEVEGLEGRFEVIPNGVHLDVKVDEDLARELEAMKTPRARIVLSVSNLIKTKGHEWVLRALGFGDIYWIVGDGPYRSRLEALVSSLGLRDRVRFFGAVKPTAVAAFMRAADVFVLPSTPEAFGIVYLEAMRARLPVIACFGEGEPSLLRHEETALLVPPCDRRAVSGALSRLAQEPELTELIVNGAFNTLMARFTAAAQCREIMRVYSEVFDESFGHKGCVGVSPFPSGNPGRGQRGSRNGNE